MTFLRATGLTRWAAPAMLLLLISACAQPGFRAEVKRFHALSDPHGESIAIQPRDGNWSIEFANYAKLLADNLTQQGYHVTDPGNATLIAELGYESHLDPYYHASSGGPIIGIGVGGGGGNVGAGVGATYDTSRDSGDYYLHTVELIVIKASTSERLYEGTASGYDRSGSPAGVMADLLDALFVHWPGESGKSETIKFDD